MKLIQDELFSIFKTEHFLNVQNLSKAAAFAFYVENSLILLLLLPAFIKYIYFFLIESFKIRNCYFFISNAYIFG